MILSSALAAYRYDVIFKAGMTVEVEIYKKWLVKKGDAKNAKPGGIDMCKAMEKNNLKREVTGAIKILRLEGASDEAIIAKVMKVFDVTREYILAILKAQVA